MVASGLFAFGTSSILATVFPVFSFPIPDVFSSDPTDRRILERRVVAPCITPTLVSVQLMAVLGLPTFLASHLRYVTTNAVENARPAIAAGRMPVLVFLSGADGFRNSNYAQVQALVSHGYIVVCLDQPGTAASTRLDDGRNVDAIPRRLMERLIDQSINPGFPPPRMNGRSFPEGFISYLAQDAVFARQQLTELNRDGLLAGRLDLQQVCAHTAGRRGCIDRPACVELRDGNNGGQFMAITLPDGKVMGNPNAAPSANAGGGPANR